MTTKLEDWGIDSSTIVVSRAIREIRSPGPFEESSPDVAEQTDAERPARPWMSDLAETSLTGRRVVRSATYPMAEVISARLGNALAEKWFALHPAHEIKTIAG